MAVPNDITALLERLTKKIGNMTPVMREIGEIVHSSVIENFEKQGRPGWAELRPVTIGQRQRQGKWPGKILARSGNLLRSVVYKADKDGVTIGTNKIYAATMQRGAKKGAFGKTKRGAPIPWGDIPARPFLMVQDEDWEDIREAITSYIKKD